MKCSDATRSWNCYNYCRTSNRCGVSGLWIIFVLALVPLSILAIIVLMAINARRKGRDRTQVNHCGVEMKIAPGRQG